MTIKQLEKGESEQKISLDISENSRIWTGWGWWYLKNRVTCPLFFIQTFMIFKISDSFC
jgi:hypothetical protein